MTGNNQGEWVGVGGPAHGAGQGGVAQFAADFSVGDGFAVGNGGDLLPDPLLQGGAAVEKVWACVQAEITAFSSKIFCQFTVDGIVGWGDFFDDAIGVA